ncbi:MAG: Dolichyl-phosphate-mannose-protein mannosyltransferase [Chloroflexi bacterium ADurb.Bin325]|nr:MAG: Dolichyl-phosphate-mannose-protein mannosyltransferase [Chloroflexi bacterium ADurb.Bin325]
MRPSPRDPLHPRAERAALGAAILLFVALGVWYNLAAPPFEKPDEVYHYAFARHLAQGNPLPVQTAEADGPWLHEGTQAPLYYFLLGRLTAGIDQSDFDRLNVQNPQVNLGVPLSPGNKNLMLYSSQPLPLRGANLAMHVGRWFSLALGCLGLLLIYLTARLAFPPRSPLPVLAVFLVAAIPQVAFIFSSVSNDSLVTVVSLAGIYWLARLVARDADAPAAWWEWSVLGLLLGLAALSKLQGLALLAPAGLVALWTAWRRRSWRLLVSIAVLTVVPAVAVAGWWYWRNYVLYGEWLAANRLLTITGLRTAPRTWRGFVGEMNGLRYSFWGLFGWFNIPLPGWVYKTLDGVTFIALGGLIVSGVRTRWRQRRGWSAGPTTRVRLFLGLWAVILVAFMVYWSTFATSSQGRLLFPMLSAFATLLVAGLNDWAGLLPRAWRLPALGILPAALVACSLYSLLVLLPAAYRAPVAVAELPVGAQETQLTYDGRVTLVGIALPEGRFHPGEAAPVTLYLAAPRKLSENLFLILQLLDEDGRTIGNITTHPGWGRLPTSLWEPGRIYEDRYLIPIDGPIDGRSPLRAAVYVTFARPDAISTPFQAYDEDGAPASPMVGQVDIAPARLPARTDDLLPVDVTFDDGIRLIGRRAPAAAGAGDELPVALLWEAQAAPQQDYTAFVHLLDANGARLAGFDEPPAANRYPTRFWRPGDRVLSEVVLALPADLPAGAYELWAGLYPSASAGAVRLPVVASDQPVQDQGVLLGTVTIR